MNKLWMLAAVGTAMIIAVPAAAQDTRGPYIAVNIGVANVDDVGLAYYDQPGVFGGTGNTNDTADFSSNPKSTIQIGGAIGYDFGPVRADLQVDYARSKIKALTLDAINGSAVTITPQDAADICDYLETESCSFSGNSLAVDSHIRTLTALANLWVDIPTGGKVTPYAGGGVGIGGYHVEGEGKARFAWQLGAGVAFNLSPSVSLTADYRHRRINGANIDDDSDGEYGVIIDKVKINSLTAGLRFRF